MSQIQTYLKKIKLEDIFAYLMISIGAIMASFSVACILLPNDAIDYGTAGVAIIISKMTGASLSACVFLVFLPFIIAQQVLSPRDWAYRTMSSP